jgi:hypothetical protein
MTLETGSDRIGISVVFALALSGVVGMGCASVEPWEKQAFSRPSMQADGDPLRSLLTEHMYFSREAASGGESIGGGGCGCN